MALSRRADRTSAMVCHGPLSGGSALFASRGRSVRHGKGRGTKPAAGKVVSGGSTLPMQVVRLLEPRPAHAALQACGSLARCAARMASQQG